jgi:hypothetical protein
MQLEEPALLDHEGPAHSTRLFQEQLPEGGLAGRKHPPEVGAAEATLPAAAGFPDKLGQRPPRRPGPGKELGERDALADAHGHKDG